MSENMGADEVGWIRLAAPSGSEVRLYDDGDGVVALAVVHGTIPVHGQALADALARLGYAVVDAEQARIERDR